MLSSAEILNFLKQNKPVLQEKYHCNQIGLFGSFARGEQAETSDIDILVVFEPNTKNLYDTEISLKKYLEKQFNRKVDICAQKWINPIFKPLILKEAVYA
jgi:predicted nucleotidyltransferase